MNYFLKKFDNKNNKFIIKKVINFHVYQLNILFDINNIFYVFLLRSADTNLLLSQIITDIQPSIIISEDGEKKYEMKKIL
jgi:hypothetical protein